MRLAVALLLAVALAGCVPPPELGPPIPGELRMSGCAAQVAFVPVPIADARAAMPDGFEALRGDPAGQTATLAAFATTCEGIANGSERYDEMLFALLVAPPDALEHEEGFHLLATGLRTSSAVAEETYRAWNVTVARQATPTVGPGNPEQPVTTGASSLGPLRVSTVIPGPRMEGEASVARVFAAEDRILVGGFDWAFNAFHWRAGTGTVDDPESVSGFALAGATGDGYIEWGSSYHFTLTPHDVDV